MPGSSKLSFNPTEIVFDEIEANESEAKQLSPRLLSEPHNISLLEARSATLMQTSNHLESLAREKIIELFQDNICFAFVFGSFAKEIASFCHDFNLFICLNERNIINENIFRTFLLTEQIRNGLHPNDEYSIEMMSKEELDEALSLADVGYVNLESLDPSSSRWSQILSDRKIFIHGDIPLLHSYESRCEIHQVTWKDHLLEELQKKDSLFSLKNFVHYQNRSSFESQRRQTEKLLMLIYHFDIDPENLKKIILTFILNKVDFVLKQIEKEYPEIIPENARIMLDGADGSFETYQAVDDAYRKTSSDVRRYIPFNGQYTFKNSSRDRRETLMNYVIKTGIAPEAMREDLKSIVTGLGSGYILNKAIQALNNNKGHVFLIPVPTYGYFIPAIAACGAKPLFVDTTPYERFALPPNILEQVIVKNNGELYKNNIKEFIRELTKFINLLKSKEVLKEEIEQKLDLSGKESKTHLSALSFQKFMIEHFDELRIKYPNLSESMLSDFPEIPRVKCLFFINPHNPLGIVFDQTYIDSVAEIASKYELTIIDDLSHMELIYSKEPHIKIGFFNQSPYPLDVITLISPSKALCMAECRVGFALINNKKLVDHYNELVFNDGLFLSKKQISALENSFILNDERARYLESNASEYKQRMQMVKYIFHPELRSEISSASYSRIQRIFEFYHLNIDDYQHGVPGVQLLSTSPESGLFCVLDFTSIQGKYFINSQLNNNQDLFALLRIYNINSLTGENIYYTDRLVIRFPICEPPLLILTAIKRLKNMMGLISCSPCSELISVQDVTTGLSLIDEKIAVVVEPKVYKEKSESDIYTIARELARVITDKSDSLKVILSDYQPHDVTNYEIERSIRTLVGMNAKDIHTHDHIDSMAVMLPSNLPLYSLVIFVIIPSFLCKHTYVRPNSILQKYDIISRLCDELELNTLFPGIEIINQDHDGFSRYIKEARLVVFTGRPSNAEKFLSDMKEDSVLVVNGAGHNPLVITESANVDAAVEGALLVKGFNGGQDCAGPDAILVHQSIATEFISKFQEKFSRLQTGDFNNPNTIIGPIHRFTELQRFAEVFHTNRSDIISGGVIDFRTGMVFPTTIVRGVERHPNYKEIYGPVAFIHPYKTDEDLALYFEDLEGQYQSNRMYTSVYGQSHYLEARDDVSDPGKPGNAGIILRNQTIHDVEIGYLPYGGYSLGASAIIKKLMGKKIERVAMPILLPEIIREYLINGKPFPFKRNASNVHKLSFFTLTTRTAKEIDPIVESFRSLASSIFKENLLFGFVFGSAAKGKLKVKGSDSDDLDTFICLKKASPKAVDEYLQKLAVLHAKYHLKVDTTFPAEIMTLATLTEVLAGLHHIDVSVDKLVTGAEFDHIFWVHALTDKKIGLLGDSEVMLGLIKRGAPHIKRWSTQIVEQLVSKESFPAYIHETFPGLNKDQIIVKLKSYAPHLIVHLGLQYDTEAPPVSVLSAGQ